MIGIRRQRGNIAPFMALALGGILLATAYSLDTSRLTNSATQLKRATDTAALAVGHAHLADSSKSLQELQGLAYNYVVHNLGLDSRLAERIDKESVTLRQSTNSDGNLHYQVAVSYLDDAELLGTQSKPITVQSTAEVVSNSLEVALAMPNTYTASNKEGNLAALRAFGKHFAEKLLDGKDNTWLAIVPYAGSVSVYDPRRPELISQWASAEGISPPGLKVTRPRPITSNILANPAIPDRRAKLLCLFRGMDAGENYAWEQAPSGKFLVAFQIRTEGADSNWVGVGLNRPSDSYTRYAKGQILDSSDTIRTSPDCPKAPVLPLSSDLHQVEQRLNQMHLPGNSSNSFDFALGWSAMALAPAFRGSSGWNLHDDLPKDFDGKNGKHNKAIVMLINGSLTPFGRNDSELNEHLRSLCSSFRERKLKVHIIVNQALATFRNKAQPGLTTCLENPDDITFIDNQDFAGSRDTILEHLERIADDLLKDSSYVRLVE